MRHFIVYGILLLAIVFLCFRSCTQQNDKTDLEQRLKLEEAAKDTIYLDKKTGDFSKDAYVGSDEVTKQFLKETDSKLSELAKNNKAAIITKTVFKHDTTVVTVRDTVKDTRTADVVTPYYQAHVVSGPEQTKISILMQDETSYYLGPDNRLHTKHSVPPDMLQVKELNSFFLEPKQKKKNGKWIGGILIGAAAVLLVTK